jgi:ATP-dependent RNA helicase DDX35
MYENLEEQSKPEILRSQLTSFVLQLKALGVGNIASFPFLTPPNQECLVRAFEMLYSLKAIDINGYYLSIYFLFFIYLSIYLFILL